MSIFNWTRKPQGASRRVQRENVELRREAAFLREELETARSRVRIQTLEIEELTDVIARNRARVRAETMAAAREMAEAETHD